VSFNWFRRTNYNATILQNRAVDPVTDWTPFTIVNPLDGSQITAYNLNKNAFGRPTDFYQTNADQGKTRNTNTGYEIGTVARLPHRGHVFAGWTLDLITDIACQMPIGMNPINALAIIDGNNITNLTLNDPNSLRYCDERSLIPFRSEFKVAGNLPLWKGFEASLTWQNDPEFEKYVNWDINARTTYPADCKGCTPGAVVAPNLTNPTERIALSVPGSRYNDRLNQVDVGIKRNFAIREKLRIQAQLDVFNVNNAHTVLIEAQSLGSTIAPFVLGGPGGRPTQILQARLLRLGLQVHF
jgi:hypothetical protein